MDNAKLTEIKERVEETPFNKAYVKGDPWKGYEVKNEGNGQTIAETPSGTDAEFIAHAYEDIPMLVAEVERLRKALFLAGRLANVGYEWQSLDTICKALNVSRKFFDHFDDDGILTEWEALNE
ncbi:hypothetical protein ACIQXW_23305 [Lysinibacillus sp. NPDC097162]|uniref:hypothetical protein n=1 Tax=Lysinibacillus sp. NPDC097162 TaxID=3364140 RepID=UPI00381F8A17